MKKTFTILMVLMVISTVVFAGGSKETEESQTLKIGVIGKSVHPYWSEVQLGAEAAGDALGIEVQFFVPQSEDSAKQLSTMEIFMAQDFDAIAIAPSDPNAIAAGIKKADELNIPVVTLDTDAPNSTRVLYVGTNNKSAGKIAGQRAAELIGNANGVIIPATGSLTAVNSLERIEGFKDGIGAKYKVLEALNDQEDPSKSLTLIEGALNTYQEIALIFGVYAYNGPAAAQAIKSSNQIGDIKIVSFDTTPDIIKWVREGVIDATIGQRPYMMGYESVRILKEIIENGKDAVLSQYPDAFVDTGVDVVTKDNIEEYKAEMISKGIPVNW